VFCPGDGLRVGGLDLRAFFEEAANHFKRGGETDVVGIALKGQAENGDALFRETTQRALWTFSKEAVEALFVDALGGFQHVELDANGGGRDG